jgi:hypothetical protein
LGGKAGGGGLAMMAAARISIDRLVASSLASIESRLARFAGPGAA